MVYHTPFAHTEVESIFDFLWFSTTSLTPSLSFYHNLCCRCLNRSCEPILDIYTSISFQLYKGLLHARSFDLFNRFLKVRDSTGTPPRLQLPKGKLTWECESSFSHSSWPAPFRPFCLGREPKIRVATTFPLNS